MENVDEIYEECIGVGTVVVFSSGHGEIDDTYDSIVLVMGVSWSNYTNIRINPISPTK